MGRAGTNRDGRPPHGRATSQGQTQEFPTCGGKDLTALRTPLFQAEHSGRYKRQALIGEYQQITGANLIVVIDQITPTNMTVLEELLFDCDPQKDLHLILS